MPERERRQQGVWEALSTTDAKHDAAHKRLRDDYRKLEEELTDALALIRDRQVENTAKISKLTDALETVRTTPPNVEKMVLTPKIMVSAVIFAVTITGGVWSATYGIRSETASVRSDVRDIITRMEAQKNATDASTKLQELQSNALRTTVDDMKRRQELQQYEIQGLKELILTGKGRTK